MVVPIVPADFEVLAANQADELTDEDWAVLTDTTGVSDGVTGKRKDTTGTTGGRKRRKTIN